MTAAPSQEVQLALTVNETPVEIVVPARRLLVDLLRDDLGLTGTHVGCEHGVCGACTVIIDDEAVRSCILLAAQADGATITTVEGISPDDGLNDLQLAFKESYALQCGFCTPGLLMTLTAADRDEYETDADIRRLLSGNLCRCTGYHTIVEAVNQFWGRREES